MSSKAVGNLEGDVSASAPAKAPTSTAAPVSGVEQPTDEAVRPTRDRATGTQKKSTRRKRSELRLKILRVETDQTDSHVVQCQLDTVNQKIEFKFAIDTDKPDQITQTLVSCEIDCQFVSTVTLSLISGEMVNLIVLFFFR